jgi:indole-3-glycerol phosphate synthase
MSRFIDALLDAEVPIVMEVKRRDPHGNDLFGETSVEDIVAAYEAADAPCISVVTGSWFGGEASMLSDVAALTDRPILLKDFVTRRSQIRDAKERGASAVLLTVEIMPDRVTASLIDYCLTLGLTPFVEVTTAAEIGRLHRAAECIVAINNKEIRQRERDAGCIERSLDLLPNALRAGCRCPVSASGISTPHVAAELLDSGFAGLLMGTAILRSGSPARFARSVSELRAPRADADAA